MNYLISFIILAIAIFINFTETRHNRFVSEEDEGHFRFKWHPYCTNCGRSLNVAIKATKYYNMNYYTHPFKFDKLLIAEKSIENPSRIRVFFFACLKPCKRHFEHKRSHKMHRRRGRICDLFRATYERDRRTGEPKIKVKKLNGREDGRKHKKIISVRTRQTKPQKTTSEKQVKT
uniref:C2H2-type domain-containing protein n=1 Tax=Strongyloides papillosus TaxID=174720 RepID=A0A0N5C5J3_STREA